MILKRINKKQKKLGNSEKNLIIKLLKRRDGYYDVVLARKKTRPNSRLCRLGYYEVFRRLREKFSVLSLDFARISKFLSLGVTLDSSFAKLIIQ